MRIIQTTKFGTVIAAICLVAVALFVPGGHLIPAARALDLDKSPAQCRLNSWKRQDGLPARRIEAMAQTRDGFLWLATRGGVARFDGKSFVTYNYKNTTDFSRDMAVAVAAGPGPGPWIGTDGGGCGQLVGDSFVPVRVAAGKTLWSRYNVVFTARDGSVWMAGQGQYALVHVNRGRVDAYPEQSSQGAAAQGCAGIAEDKAGRIWMLSWSGLHCRNPDGSFNNAGNAPDGTALLAARQGGFWIGTRHGLMRINGSRTHSYHMADGLPAEEIRSLCEDREGSLWVGTPAGLARFKGSRFTCFSTADGLTDNNIGPILEDREGSLWIATDSGLNRLAHTKLTPIDFRSSHGEAPLVSAPTEGLDGTVWFPTSLGIYKVHGYQTTLMGASDGVPVQNVKAIAADLDGSLVLATGGTLYRWKNGRANPLPHACEVDMLTRDTHGILAIGHDHFLYRCRGQQLDRLARLPAYPWCFSCCVDSHDTLWLATTAGLVRVSGTQSEIYTAGLPEDTHVLAVSEGSSGEMWLGTDHGVARFKDGKFRVYSAVNGLPDNNIYVACEDGEGRLWIGGTRGILSMRLADMDAADSGLCRTIDYVAYDDADGIRQFPVSGYQLHTRDGRLWFTGEKGATVVDPRNIRNNSVIPSVIIERASGDGQPLMDSTGCSLPPGTKKLEFCYTSNSMAAPERVMFRYRLVGYDKGWVDANSRRAAYYTNLPPGQYRFEVTACNNDGLWNPVGATYEFTLKPHFYQTGWFIALCTIVGLGSVACLARLRLEQLRRHNRALENRVALRTAELNSSLDELNRSKQMVENANAELQSSREELVAYNGQLTAINDALEAANARLESLATTDGMTGIANHRAFQDQMRAIVARAARAGSRTGLLLCDVDRFKQYNDSFGHPAGDEVLRLVAHVLQSNVREGDLVARYGGEEFAILLPNADEDVARDVAERLRRAIEAFDFPQRRITVSIGGSAPMGGVVTPQQLVESADRALYAAKHTGRNRIVISSADTVLPRAPGAEQFAAYDAQAAFQHVEPDDITELADGLLQVLNLRDAETNGHSQRVALFTVHLARQAEAMGLHEFSGEEMRCITLGALLHDIGKVGIPDAILYKPASLTAEEWEVMRAHPTLGAEVLQGCPHFAGALPIVRYHHERWDGGGYPDRLAGTAIPLAARIFALADSLDAMSTNRPYREALPPETVREEIKRMAGKQFDPVLVQVFLSIPSETWGKLARHSAANSTIRDLAQQSAVSRAA